MKWDVLGKGERSWKIPWKVGAMTLPGLRSSTMGSLNGGTELERAATAIKIRVNKKINEPPGSPGIS